MRRTKPGRTHRDGGTLREPRHCSLAAWPGLWCFLGLLVAPSALAAPTPKGTAIVTTRARPEKLDAIEVGPLERDEAALLVSRVRGSPPSDAATTTTCPALRL